jgi:transcriptional regulator of heat shock response
MPNKSNTGETTKSQKPEDQDIVLEVYKEYETMRGVSNKTYPEFNDRTLKNFLDDSQKRANAYILSKDEQDKDDWQANIFTQFTRNKIKAQIASVAKRPPDIAIRATNENNDISVKRAEVMKHLVMASYLSCDGNPE